MNELRHSTIIPNFSDALIAHEENDLETAQKLYKEFLILDPNNPEANYNLGSIYLTQADYDRSLKFFKLALEASPNVPIFWSSSAGKWIHRLRRYPIRP